MVLEPDYSTVEVTSVATTKTEKIHPIEVMFKDLLLEMKSAAGSWRALSRATDKAADAVFGTSGVSNETLQSWSTINTSPSLRNLLILLETVPLLLEEGDGRDRLRELFEQVRVKLSISLDTLLGEIVTQK